MRTKHLLTALMLPAVFAACTQEELVDVNNNMAQTERVSVGEITIVAGENADSRFAATEGDFNGLVTAAGDELGAVLVDEVASSSITPSSYDASSASDLLKHKALYQLTDNVNTNYGFEQSGNSWTSYAKMVEGNYLFYLPYQAGHSKREALTSVLPSIQNLTVTNNVVDKVSAMNDVIGSGNTIVAMGYKFIDRDDAANVAVDFLPIYAYPLISLVNAYKEVNSTTGEYSIPYDLVIKQIAIVNNHTNGFATKYTVDADGSAAGVSALTATTGAVKAFSEAWSYPTSSDPVSVAAGSFIEVEDTKYAAKTSDVLDEVAGETSKAIVLKPSANINLAQGQKVEFYAVIPAESYDRSGETLTIQVLTNKGIFEKTIANPAIAAGRRYPLSEYEDNGEVIAPTLDPDGSLIETGKGSEYQIVLACDPSNVNTLSSTASIIVSSTSDLVAQLRNAVNSASLNVTALTKDVCFDAAAAAALKANTKANFALTINGDVTLTSGFADGTATGKSVSIIGKAYANGQNVSLTDKWTITSGVEVTGGTMNIEKVPSISALTINSGATVNVATGLNPRFTIDNKGTLNTYSIVNLIGNTGNVTIGADATSGSPKSLTWLADKFVNSTNGTIEVAQYCTIDLTSATAATNAGTINNYGTIKKSLINNKTINNYGTLSEIKNDKNIFLMSASSKVYKIAKNATKGYIKNNVDVTTFDDTDGVTFANQYVYYEFGAEVVNGGLYPQAGKVNTILLTGTTWNPTADQDLSGYRLELNGATISVYTPGVQITVGEVYVSGNSVVKGSSSAYYYETVAPTVASGKTFTVNNITRDPRPANP